MPEPLRELPWQHRPPAQGIRPGNRMKEMKKHRFSEKHPLAAAIIISVILMAAALIIGQVPAIIYRVVTGKEFSVFSIIMTVLGVAAALYLYKWWFRPDYKGPVTDGNIGEGFLLCLPILLYWAVSIVLALIDGSFSVKPVTMSILYTSFMAGFLEELVFRYSLINTLLRKWNTKERILAAVWVSSLIFGLAHGSNALSGANAAHTILQVFDTVCIGVLFAAIYVRSGHILPCMILHTAQDIFAIATDPAVEDSGIITGSITWLNAADVFLCIGLCALGLYYLRPKFRDGIPALWDRIWNREGQDSAAPPSPD